MKNLIAFLILSFTFIVPAKSAESDVWIERLIAAHWTPTAAQSIITINQEWFTELAANHPQPFERILRDLEALGQLPNWINLLERHPEIAGLAIGAENPRLLYRVLTATSQACWPWILQQYTFLAAPPDAAKLTVALERHQKPICQLAQAGIPGAAAVFLFDETRSGAKEYASWLEHTLLTPALRNSWRSSKPDTANTSLIENVTFAVTQGPELRERMAKNPEFRHRLPELWQALNRAIADTSLREEKFALVAAEPQIWDLLQLDEGEEILRNWGPEVPIALLLGPTAVPQDLQPMVLRALHQQHDDVVAVLQKHLGDQNLYNLMRRTDLDVYQIERVLNALDGFCPDCPNDYSTRLAYFARLSPAAIQSQFAPPATSIVTWMPFHNESATVYKALLGREVSTAEWALLGVSVVATFVPGGALLKGTKVVAQNLKSPTVQELAKKFFKTIAPQLTTVQQVLPKAFSDVLKQQIVPFVGKHVAQLEKLTTIDIKTPVQWMFEKTGIGRESFKNLTGLEARVFMRGDAKVFVYPTRSQYVRDYVKDKIQDTIVDTFKTKVTPTKVAATVLTGSEIADYAIAHAKTDANQQYQDWQRNASQWWLLNGAGLAMDE